MKRGLLILVLLCQAFTFVLAQATVAPSATPTATPSRILDETSIKFNDANATGQPGDAVVGAQGAGFLDFLRMFLVLALVVAAIYGVYFLIRKNRKKDAKEAGMIKVLGTRTLPGNHYLHVVELGSHVFFIGNSEHNIQVLKEIDDQETLDEIRLKAGEDDSGSRSFADLIQSVFKTQENNSEIRALKEKKKRFGKFGDKS